MPVVLAPAEVLAGLIAVCVLLCAVLIANILRAVLQAVNVFGLLSPLVSAADWLATHALSAMSWLWAKTNPVAVWIALVNVWHSTENGLLAVVGGDVLNALQRIVTVAIPNAAHWAVAQAQALATALGHDIDLVWNWANASFIAIGARITATVTMLQSWTLGQIGLAVQAVERDLAIVRTVALAAVTALRNDLVAFVTVVRTEVLGRVITVEQEIATEIPRIEAEVVQIATVAIPALDLAITAVRDIAVEVEQCTAPICGPNVARDLGDLGKLLQSLTPVVEGGLLFALLAEAIANPVGTAHEIEAVVGGTVNGAVTVLRDAVGLAA